MGQTSNIYFNRRPNNIIQMGRCLTKNLFSKKEIIIPPIIAEQQDVKFDKEKIASYRKVCKFSDDSNNLVPAIYPHILAFPLHLEVMLHPNFPVTPIGMVHLRNSIEQYRPIMMDESLTIRVQLGSECPSHRGYEFDIETRIYSHGDLIWKSISTNLIRTKPVTNTEKPQISKASKLKDIKITEIEGSKTETIDMAKNWGIQYGLVSGDLNPIHLYPWSAKIFGFKKNIAHGMASAATIFSTLNKSENLEKFRFITIFKNPIFLPDIIKINYHKDSKSDDLRFFAYSNKHNIKNHRNINIEGSLISI